MMAEKALDLRFDLRIVTCWNNLKNFLKDSFGKLDQFVMNAWGTNNPETAWRRGLMYDLARYLGHPFPSTFFAATTSIEARNSFLDEILALVKSEKFSEKLKNAYGKTIVFIDEAPDLPPKYFEILKQFCPTIYVFWDDQQQSGSFWSSISDDIVPILNISQSEKSYLDVNFRNTRQIYDFAKLTGHEEDGIEVPRDGSIVEIYVSGYDKNSTIREILRRAENTNTNIAIIVSGSHGLDFEWIEIQELNTWSEYIDYSRYDTFCLNLRNNKGLEFDSVILADFEPSDFSTAHMYVSCTRAKKRLYVLTNEDFLRWKESKIDNHPSFNIIREDEIRIEDIPF